MCTAELMGCLLKLASASIIQPEMKDGKNPGRG